MNSFLLQIESHFDRQTFLRGATYQRRQRVLGADFEDFSDSLVASVRGSGNNIYDVEINLTVVAGRVIDVFGTCTCPMAFNCKHVAAALIEAGTTFPNLLEILETGDESAILPPPADPGQPALPPPVAQWLDHLKISVARHSGGYHPKEHYRLLYILEVRLLHGSLRTVILPMKARLRKDGTFSRPENYSIANIRPGNSARFVHPVDERIAGLLQAANILGYDQAVALSTDLAPDILTSILDTGRCRWLTFDGPALSLGEPLPANPVWNITPDGKTLPGWDAAGKGIHILPMPPPWYVNLETAQCGPLSTPLEPSVAAKWTSGPELEPQHLQAFTSAFKELTPSTGLPEPAPLESVKVGDVPPTPHLTLFSEPVQVRAWQYQDRYVQPDSHHWGELSASYDGCLADPDDKLPVLHAFNDGKVMEIQRDLAAEKLFGETLRNHGLTTYRPFAWADPSHGKTQWVPGGSIDWLGFLLDGAPRLREAGWTVAYDPSFEIKITEPDDWYTDIDESRVDWFDVELGVTVDGERINLVPVLVNLLASVPDLQDMLNLEDVTPDSIVPVDLGNGRLLPMPAGRLQTILDTVVELFDFKAMEGSERIAIPRLRAAELSQLDKDQWNWTGGDSARELAEKIQSFEGIQPVKPPPGLGKIMRDYQKEGLNWLQFLREYSLAGILADDMGLGKTLQALAHLMVEKRAKRLDQPALVVAPTSLMNNWLQEARHFTPRLKTLVLHGLDRKERFGDIPKSDLVITSYALLPRDKKIHLGQNYHTVVLDEAQWIKNPKTQAAQIASQLKTRHRLCLTGTPMENHLGELWSLFNFLLPGFLGGQRQFRTLFRNPIEKGHSPERQQILHRRVSPFILRRRKGDVARELPPKSEIVQSVELADAQRDLYETIRVTMDERVRAEIADKGLARSHIIILEALLKLRQACCDPRLVKLAAARKVKESAKLSLLFDLLPEMVDEGRRILLFSQFTSMLALIEEELKDRNILYTKLTGQTRDRAECVETFQSGKVPVFLISLKAGGTGLNLTRADTVILYDPWWNPAVEEQAMDRAHRIGQDKHVFVYKLITTGTVEEKIAELQKHKQQLVKDLLSGGAQSKLSLEADDLDVLLAPIS